MNYEASVHNEVDYEELLRKFSLLRRPYVTIVDELRNIQLEVENHTDLKIGTKETDHIAPFDFQVYSYRGSETSQDLKDVFKWLLGYDSEKIENIIKHKSVFGKTDKWFDNETSDNLTKHYDKILRGNTRDNLELITAIYHMVYDVNHPVFAYNNESLSADGNFVPGLFHVNKFLKDGGSFLYKGRLIEKDNDFPYLEIDNVKYGQVTNNFKVRHFDFYKEYYESWIPVIQKFEYLQNSYILYYPIFDGSDVNKGSLRGYLGIYCKDGSLRDRVGEHFDAKELKGLQDRINSAYIKGTQNAILDGFAFGQEDKDPLKYWVKHLERLHNWKSVDLVPKEDQLHKTWQVLSDVCFINIPNLVDISTIKKELKEELKATIGLSNTIKLTFLQQPLLRNVGSLEDYGKKRMSEMVNLFWDLLVHWEVYKNEKSALQASRKAAISQVMARNMSHNHGSHVLSRMIHRDQIKDLLSQHEGVRYILSEKLNK